MSADAAFPSAPVKAALRSPERSPERAPLAFFCKALADDLPPEEMYASAFVLAARLLLADPPPALRGYPRVLYATVEMMLPKLAREVLPAEHVAEALEMIEATS